MKKRSEEDFYDVERFVFSLSLKDVKQRKMLVKTRLNKQHLNHNLTQLKISSIVRDDQLMGDESERFFQGYKIRSEDNVRFFFSR